MIDVGVATDCLGAVRRLERQAQAVTMTIKSHPIVREFHLLKSKIFKSIEFIEVDAHQDDLKSLDELSFFEQLNVKCDDRAKALTLNVSEDKIIPFPLELSSPYAMIATNRLILNYPKDISIRTHLLKCENHLEKLSRFPTSAQ